MTEKCYLTVCLHLTVLTSLLFATDVRGTLHILVNCLLGKTVHICIGQYIDHLVSICRARRKVSKCLPRFWDVKNDLLKQPLSVAWWSNIKWMWKREKIHDLVNATSANPFRFNYRLGCRLPLLLQRLRVSEKRRMFKQTAPSHSILLLPPALWIFVVFHWTIFMHIQTSRRNRSGIQSSTKFIANDEWEKKTKNTKDRLFCVFS